MWTSKSYLFITNLGPWNKYLPWEFIKLYDGIDSKFICSFILIYICLWNKYMYLISNGIPPTHHSVFYIFSLFLNLLFLAECFMEFWVCFNWFVLSRQCLTLLIQLVSNSQFFCLSPPCPELQLSATSVCFLFRKI